MSTLKHTPGPWKFMFGQTPEFVTELLIGTGNGDGWISKTINVGSQNDEILAEVKAYTTDGFLHDFEQWAANAKLIAAAPDLLEALQKVAAYDNDQLRNQLNTWQDYDRQLKHLAGIALAAIKKATE